MKPPLLVLGEHVCPIYGCVRVIKSGSYLCNAHLLKVSLTLRNAVDFEQGNNPWTDGHYKAMQNAIDYVNVLLILKGK